MNSGIRELDHFQIISKGNLSIDDRNTLTLLYQPLIGVSAYSFYMTLWSLIDRTKATSKKYYHKNLINILNVSPSVLLKARQRLEAIGLLVVYYDENDYIYELKSPLSANQFVKDGMLGMYLFSTLGKKVFDELISLFTIDKVDTTNYKNITKTFDEIFKSVDSEPIKSDDDFIDSNKGASLSLYNRDFDYDLFISGISSNFIDKRRLSKKFKDTIIKLAYVYNLDEFTMQKVYLDCIDPTNQIDYIKLSKSARKWYQFISNKSIPRLSDKIDDEIPKKATSKDSKDALTLFKTYNPKELLEYMSGSKAASSDLNVVEKLLLESNLEVEVINVLIAFIIGLKDGKMPNYTYFEKVASEWKRNKISSAEQAWDYINKNHQPKTKKTKQAIIKDVEVDWFDDYWKSVK